MDPITLLGILGALAVVVTANVLEGGNPTSLLLVAPMLLVFGGTILISLAGGTMADAKAIVPNMKRAFTGTDASAKKAIPGLVRMADKARREGLLSLEESLRTIKEPFLRKGIQMVVDSVDADEVRDVLEGAIVAKKAETKQQAKFFTECGGYAPTIGIVGTVMGLVHVLENLSAPEELGHLIAGAFVATLWGVMSANVIFLPIASRLKRLGDLEVEYMNIVVEGIAAIQAGANPRIIDSKLRALLPAGSGGSLQEAA